MRNWAMSWKDDIDLEVSLALFGKGIPFHEQTKQDLETMRRFVRAKHLIDTISWKADYITIHPPMI